MLNCYFEGIRTDLTRLEMTIEFPRTKQPDGSQATSIPEPKRAVFTRSGKPPFDSQMGPVRRVRKQHQARHPRFNHHRRTVRNVQHDPLAQPANLVDRFASQPFCQLFKSRANRDRLIATATALDAFNLSARDMGANPANHRLDFGQFRHVLRISNQVGQPASLPTSGSRMESAGASAAIFRSSRHFRCWSAKSET